MNRLKELTKMAFLVHPSTAVQSGKYDRYLETHIYRITGKYGSPGLSYIWYSWYHYFSEPGNH